MPSVSLDLGCGRRPKNHFNADIVCGIDVRDDVANNIIKADLIIEPIPFPDNYFDFVTAHDFLEHIPRLLYCPNRRLPFVELMSEIYRVLKPNGFFFSQTPAFPHGQAFCDPTHVNIITEQTFPLYFDDNNNWAVIYGFVGAFKITNQRWNNFHLETTMSKSLIPNHV